MQPRLIVSKPFHADCSGVPCLDRDRGAEIDLGRVRVFIGYIRGGRDHFKRSFWIFRYAGEHTWSERFYEWSAVKENFKHAWLKRKRKPAVKPAQFFGKEIAA